MNTRGRRDGMADARSLDSRVFFTLPDGCTRLWSYTCGRSLVSPARGTTRIGHIGRRKKPPDFFFSLFRLAMRASIESRGVDPARRSQKRRRRVFSSPLESQKSAASYARRPIHHDRYYYHYSRYAHAESESGIRDGRRPRGPIPEFTASDFSELLSSTSPLC